MLTKCFLKQTMYAKKQMLNTACREQISFTPAFISLLFLFSFHNKNVLFCFENEQKESISSSMKNKII